MNELTIKLIYDIKRPKDEWKNNENNHTLIDFAICSLMDWSGCEREVYTPSKIYEIVRTSFADYLTTANHIMSIMNDYYESLDRYTTFSQLFYPNTSKEFYPIIEYHQFETLAMLEALQLTQVKNDKGEYINGFYDYDKED